MQIQWIILLRVIFFVLFGLESPFFIFGGFTKTNGQRWDESILLLSPTYNSRNPIQLPDYATGGISSPVLGNAHFLARLFYSSDESLEKRIHSLMFTHTHSVSLSLSRRHTLYNLCRYPPPTLPFSHRRFKVLVFYV